MSNIVVMNKNTVSTFKSKRTPEQNRSEIIDADFKEVYDNPKKSSGTGEPKPAETKVQEEFVYDGGKIIQKWFVGFIVRIVERIVDKFMNIHKK